MATYTYFCDKHLEFDVEHSINDKLTECPKCKEEGNENSVKRLISKTSFILNGSGWAKDNYS